jgi:hypothetical protein
MLSEKKVSYSHSSNVSSVAFSESSLPTEIIQDIEVEGTGTQIDGFNCGTERL